ncbi:hypothetical protein ACFS27_18600 [Promicromonospora vindobonensis]|uniref:AbiEi antitoxin of type IV toxin-antitoxin system n=1 Tax=Promicromonospora vindobonensis TaxID=195748 RepID=A0ABW5VX10_9MICO
MNVTPSARDVAVPPVLLAGERDRNQLALDRRRGSLVRIRRGAYWHPLEALVIVDSALRLGARREDLLTLLGARAGRRGIRQALLVVELGEAGAQSAWETWVRYEILHAGLPRPTTQMAVRRPDWVTTSKASADKTRAVRSAGVPCSSHGHRATPRGTR